MESMPRANGVLDRLRAVRVRGNFASQLVGFLGDSLQFFERVLRRAGLIAFAQHAAGSADLDQVGAILDRFANLGARRPRTVGHAFRPCSGIRRQKIVVAMARR